MTGLYLHIPFCKSRCIYCGFYSTTLSQLQGRYVDALCKEMEMRRTDDSIATIYMGGGTPSQLSPDNLQRLFTNIYNIYNVSPHAEVTIECNPDDITAQYATTLSQLPINRISMGIQTFSDDRLHFLHRRHTAEQARNAVRLLRAAGFTNISIDLMFGFPGETLESWQRDINEALSLGVEHISAYSLIYEEGTPLYELRIKNEELGVTENDELSRQMYEVLIDKLEAAGYEHYEISNFAKLRTSSPPAPHESFRSQHNSSYWNGTPYIGLGAAAHSYDGAHRQWNVSDIRQYIDDIYKGIIPCQHEDLDETTKYNDLITTALRTKEGINLNTLGKKYRDYLLSNAKPALANNLLAITDGHIHLTRQGLFVSDDVMSDLILI